MLSLPRTRSRAGRLAFCWFGALITAGVASTCCAAASVRETEFPVHRRRRSEPLGRLSGQESSIEDASHRSPGGDGYRVYELPLRRAGLQSITCGVDVRDASGDHRLLSQWRLLEATDSRGQERRAHAADVRVSHDRDGKDLPLRQLLCERVGCLPAASGSGSWCGRRQDGGFSRSAGARPARRRSGGLAHGRLLHRAIAAGAHAAILSGVWAAQASPAVCRATEVLRNVSAGEYRTAALSGG